MSNELKTAYLPCFYESYIDLNIHDKIEPCTHLYIKNFNKPVKIPEYCTYLVIESGSITHFTIPNHIKDFYCAGLGTITSLDIPDGLETLNCSGNPIDELFINNNMLFLDCHDCKIKKLISSSNLSLITLNIQNNFIEDIDFMLPMSLQQLEIYGNKNIKIKHLDFLLNDICLGDYFDDVKDHDETFLYKLFIKIKNGETYIDYNLV